MVITAIISLQVFRKSVSRLTTHSEAIAALAGEYREGRIIMDNFKALNKHVSKMIQVQVGIVSMSKPSPGDDVVTVVQPLTSVVLQWRFGMVEDFITKYCASTVAMIVILGPFFGGNLRTDYSPEGNATTLATMRYVTSVIINQVGVTIKLVTAVSLSI
jgi:ABC-type uncharacterized transport system fused permease/ATPase subunit